LLKSGTLDDERTLVLLKRLAPVHWKTLGELDSSKEQFSLFLDAEDPALKATLKKKGFRLFRQVRHPYGELFDVSRDISRLEPLFGSSDTTRPDDSNAEVTP
jgi:hypothetical protein